MDAHSFDPWVLFPDGRRLRRSEIEANQATREHTLAPYRGNKGDLRCGCVKDGIQLGVGKREKPHNIYFFYPLHRTDVARHAFGCSFKYEREEASPSLSTPSVEWTSKGLNVNLDGSLYISTSAAEPSEVKEKKEPTQKVRAGTSLTVRGSLETLLEAIWVSAELHFWRASFLGKRTYFTVRDRITNAVSQMQVRNHALSNLFYMPPLYNGKNKEECNQALKQFKTSLEPDGQNRQWYGYAVGMLRKVNTDHQGVTGLHLMYSAEDFWVTNTQWAVWQEVWPVQDMDRCFCIIKVIRRQGKRGVWYEAVDMAAIQLTDRTSWIPVYSRYERELALELVQQQRSFRRPLLADWPADWACPSFVLEDQKPRTHLEIKLAADLEDPASLTARQTWYAKMEQDVWWWDVTESPDVVPDLPPMDRPTTGG